MNEFKQHMREHRIAYTVLGIILLVLLGGIIIRESSKTFGARGTLAVQAHRTGTAISVDGVVLETIRATGTTELALTPGEHRISLEKVNTWPWQKTVTITEGETTTIAPFNLPREPRFLPLSAGIPDDQPRSASLFVVEKDYDNPSFPLLNEEETVAIWQDEAGIHAEWRGATSSMPLAFCVFGTCETEFLVTPLQEKATSIHFMPGRDDVLLLTTDEGIFGLELDRRPMQNYQPLLAAPGIDMRRRDSESMYVKAEGTTYIYQLY